MAQILTFIYQTDFFTKSVKGPKEKPFFDFRCNVFGRMTVKTKTKKGLRVILSSVLDFWGHLATAKGVASSFWGA